MIYNQKQTFSFVLFLRFITKLFMKLILELIRKACIKSKEWTSCEICGIADNQSGVHVHVFETVFVQQVKVTRLIQISVDLYFLDFPISILVSN